MKQGFFLSFLLILLVSSCGTQRNINYYEFETECLGSEFDGSQTLKAWGKGKNRRDAIDQAQKNALLDVIYKGIHKGGPDCQKIPLVTETMAKQKYEDYFYEFFAPNGLYLNFISRKDGRKTRRYHADHEKIYEVTVRILRNDLKNQLIQDGIIN